MAANTVVALATLQDLVAEKAAWGGPEWTVIGLATAAASVATLAGATNANSVKVQHYLDYVTFSGSLANTVATSVQIKDGSTVIWEAQFPISTAPMLLHFDFSDRPLRCTAGAALIATISSTLGAGAVGEVSMVGHSNVPFTPA